jgi:hypothetical protein
LSINSRHIAPIECVGQIKFVYSYECFDEFDQQIESLQDRLHDIFPSVYPCRKWITNVNKSIADNKFAYFGIYERSDNIVDVWISPKQVNRLHESIRDKWISQAKSSLKRLCGVV